MDISKSTLIEKVAARTGKTKKATEAILEATLATIADELIAGNKVKFIGFGTFEVRERKARTGTNPRTGELIEIADSKVPAFKSAALLKKRVNQ